MRSKRVKSCAVSLPLLFTLLISPNVEAGRYSPDSLEGMHRAAFDLSSSNDRPAGQELKEVYEEILAVYPNDALARDKLAYMTSADFYEDEPPSKERSTTNSDRTLLVEAVEYLKEAYMASCDENASRDVFGFSLEGTLVSASEKSIETDKLAALRGVVEYDLKSLENVLDVQFSALDHGAERADRKLMIAALVVNRDGQAIVGREFWLISGEFSANDAAVTRDLDRSHKIRNPHTTLANGETPGLSTDSRATHSSDVPRAFTVLSIRGSEKPCR